MSEDRIVRLFEDHKSELAAELSETLRKSTFHNRYTLHPRRLDELGDELMGDLHRYLRHRPDNGGSELGKSHAIEGLGERSILMVSNSIRSFFAEQAQTNHTERITADLKTIDEYLTGYLHGYMMEREAQTLRDQEQLEKALSAALYHHKRELLIRNQAIHSSGNGILLCDLEGEINYVNPAFLEMWEYESSQEVMSSSVDRFWGEGELDEILQSLHSVGGWQNEFSAVTRRGNQLRVMVSASIIRDEMDKALGVMSSFIDVTERHELEQRLQKSQKLEAIGNLAGGIAHDFNNLLTVIIGFNQMLQEYTGDDERLMRYLNGIQDSAQSATTLVQQLLAFSRKQILKPRVVDLKELIDQTRNILVRLIREDITFQIDLDPNLGYIEADPSQVEQVLINLIVNARDAMPGGGRLSVSAENITLSSAREGSHDEIAPGEYILLKIQDTGLGMDGETQSRIFEPFFTTKGIGKGTGMGLSTVYGIIRQSEGYISVESKPGRGTTFLIYLPKLEREPGGDGTGDQSDQEPVPGQSQVILLVEDDDPVREVAGEVLKDRGYYVLEARNGQEALDVIETTDLQIDLVITDVVMPEMNGPQLVRELGNRYNQMKALYISGYAEEEILREGLTKVEIPFLSKPFSPNELLRTVSDIME